MTTILLPPSSGILLNSSNQLTTKQITLPARLPHVPSSQSESSASSSYSSRAASTSFQSRRHIHSRSYSSPNSPLRVRFAPLPDPRSEVSGRSSPVIPTAWDSSSRVSIGTLPAASDSQPTLTPLYDSASASSSPTIETSTPLFLPSTPETVHQPLSDCSAPPPSPPPFNASSSYASSSWSTPAHKSKGKNFFKPFIKRGSSPAPGRLGISPEELLTLGAINLFRTSSKDSQASRRSSQSEGGGSAWKWRPSSTTAIGKEGKDWFAAPLMHVHAPPTKTQRSASMSSGTSAASKRAALSGGFSPLSGITAGRKGTRMLNGRVYGVKPPPNANTDVNPFANARDDEPEFVEWGYGGMGSVKNTAGTGATVWSRLQGSGVMVGSVEGKASEGEDDDGSGMAWVRKKREARERLKAQEAEREESRTEKLAEADGGYPSISDRQASRDLPASSRTIHAESESDPLQNPPTTATTPSSTLVPSLPSFQTDLPGRDAVTSLRPAPASKPTPGPVHDQHEIVTASVPAPSTHRRTPSRGHSDLSLSLLTPRAVTPTPVVVPEVDVQVPRPASEDEDGDDDVDGSEDAESEDEDDDEPDVREELRKTSVCAGVEKISRHK